MNLFNHRIPIPASANLLARVFTALMLVALLPAGAFAAPITASGTNWSITLSEADRTGPPGSILTYSGSIGNTTGSDLFIDAATLNFTASAPSSDFKFDLAPEFLDTLGIIGVSSYNGPLFFVEWFATAPGTTGTGTFELTAAPPGNPTTLSVAFSAAATKRVVPTPGSLPLLLVGLIGIICLRSKPSSLNAHLRLVLCTRAS